MDGTPSSGLSGGCTIVAPCCLCSTIWNQVLMCSTCSRALPRLMFAFVGLQCCRVHARHSFAARGADLTRVDDRPRRRLMRSYDERVLSSRGQRTRELDYVTVGSSLLSCHISLRQPSMCCAINPGPETQPFKPQEPPSVCKMLGVTEPSIPTPPPLRHVSAPAAVQFAATRAALFACRHAMQAPPPAFCCDHTPCRALHCILMRLAPSALRQAQCGWCRTPKGPGSRLRQPPKKRQTN